MKKFCKMNDFFKISFTKILFFIIILNLSIQVKISCQTIKLTLPTFDYTYPYFHELLKKSLESEGYKVEIIELSPEINQKRIMKMLEENDQVTLHWRGQSAENDKLFVPVRVDLTDRLKGHRVFFIRKGTQYEYNKIRTLEDFRSLGKVGGFGVGWSDVAIWEYNKLSVDLTDGDWDPVIYKKLEKGNRGVDYFSRGIIEMAVEAPKYPELDVEKRLVFIYPNDFRFYLSKANKKLQPILESALKKAQKNGLMKSLLKKHFPEVFDKNKLNLEGRIKIYLKLPPQ